MSILATVIVVTNIGYTAAFDTETRCPAWVAYDLEPSEVVRTERMPLPFCADPRIGRATDNAADYAGSGYDRGHFAPAADFNWSVAALNETYYYSNICPMAPRVNRGAWCVIEQEMRQLAASGTVHIVTFPYGWTTGRVGRVAVPANLVKVAWGWFGVRFYVIGNGKPTNERNETK